MDTMHGQVAQVTQPKPTPSILETISTVVVLATTSKFVAKEKFVRDISPGTKVKISCIGDDFILWFLNGGSKTEDPITEQRLYYHVLKKVSMDKPIIGELGGVKKSETMLSEMFALMEKQGKGESGVLLNKGYLNIFYIRDQKGALRSVRVYWDSSGWDVYASSIEDQYRCHCGHRVFSRNSVLKSSEPSDLA